MVSTIYISADVIQNSMLNAGDALAAFVSGNPQRQDNVFRYEKADIRITAANGSVYLMSEAETTQQKIAFTPLPAKEIGALLQSMAGGFQPPEVTKLLRLLNGSI